MIFLIFLFFHLCFGKERYAIVVDAGSTGSRFHVYHWEDIKEIFEQTIPEDVTMMNKLAGYVGNETGLNEDLMKHIKEVLKYIPDAEVNSTPFYLGATAGLRLLSSSDAEWLIQKVRNVIEKETKLHYDSRFIRVLSGEEEGIFGWITVQYVEGDFTFTDAYGALDMGGASTQISFVPKTEQILADKKTVKLFDEVVDVYTHSFLRYGLNEAYELSINELLLDQPSTNISHPCLLKGYQEVQKGRNFYGTSDFEECSALMEKILHLNTYCFYPNSTCSVDGDYVPNVRPYKFFAFSGFYYLLVGLNINSTSAKGMTLGDLKQKAYSFCEDHSFQWAKEHSGFGEDYIPSQCFNLNYAISLLTNGYKFPEDSDQIEFVSKVAGKSVGWTIGNLLYEEMFLDHSPSCEKQSDDFEKPFIVVTILLGLSWMIIVLLVIGGIILSVGLLFFYFTGKKKQSDYEQIKEEKEREYSPVN